MLSVRRSLGAISCYKCQCPRHACNNSVSHLVEGFRRLQLKIAFDPNQSLSAFVVVFFIQHGCSKGSNNGGGEVLQWQQSQSCILLHYSGLDLSSHSHAGLISSE